MLEEVTMEKKLNRSVSVSKGNADSKKSQDGPVTKLFPKSSRKREKPGQKLEQLCKKQGHGSQKNKHHGKRSTPRSSYHESGRKNSELGGLDDDFEFRGRKQGNLNHLLNFHCKPRENIERFSYRSPQTGLFPNTIRNLMVTQKHKYNKEQFLQANCQFVVKANADYSIYLADPDILVDWSLVEQIVVPSSEGITCPICLDFPKAGQITRCGHIYCWPCILHYLALTEKSWHKCPICFEAVKKKDLRSVKLSMQKFHNTGSEIKLKLMQREKDTTVAIPVTEAMTRMSNVLLPASGSSFTTVYSKLLHADFNHILEIVKAEENELKEELKDNEGCPEMCFIEQALELLSERRRILFMEMNSRSINPVHVNSEFVDGKSKVSMCESNEMHFEKCLTSGVEVEEAACSRADSEENVSINEPIVGNEFNRSKNKGAASFGDELLSAVLAENSESNGSNNSFKRSLFYQVEDGQQIYLHPLNVRMLERQFGCLERSPLIIKGRIVEIENGSMTEELRRRLRHLQHLPVTCQFQNVEIDFLEPEISKEVNEYFKDQLGARLRQREIRAKKERRFEKQAQMHAKRQFGNHSPPRDIRLDSRYHFPECGSDTPPNMSPRNRSPLSSRTSSPVSSTSKRSLSPVTKSLNSLSLSKNTFAQKLKESNVEGPWKQRTAVSESEASSSHSRNLISDAVEAALVKARLEKESKSEDASSSKNKKKKKQKALSICSVGMVYTNR